MKLNGQNRLRAFLCMYLVLSPLYAQEKNQEVTSTQAEQRLKDLRIRALQDDIATASYFELQELARKWELDPNLDIASLKTSLYNKLQIPAPASRSANKEDMVIRIESAQKAQAFTIERQAKDSEDYFKISGGVKLWINDQREGYEHSVHADSIILNRRQNTIRAEGQVTYIKKKQNSEDTEKFTGDSLIFRLRLWRGLIFYGIFSRSQTTETKRPANIHDKSSNPEKTKADPDSNKGQDKDTLLGKTVLATNEIRYYFDGEKIRKGSDDVLVLEKGAIATSEREQNEYFRLGFYRLWIFGKPEWAMLSATLYVGHIPVLYLPYYYHNDSQLLFHPVFGIREAYGEFIQTTTYLLGKPQLNQTDSLSFLPVSSGAEKDSNLKLDALYLVPANKEKEPDKKQQKTTLDAGSHVKFLLDYYSYIGLFTGLNGQFKNLGVISSLDFAASIAYAYALEERSGEGFAEGKPYILGEDGRYRLELIKSSFLGQPLPFRFGFDTKLRSKNNTFTLDFTYYSDPFYKRDYLNRTESFDWIGYALERVQRQEGGLLEELRKKESLISSYKWEAGLNLRPRFKTSLLRSFDLKAYIAVYFSKRSDTGRKAYDPTREFFYPTKILLPDTSLRISGTFWPILQTTRQTAKTSKLPILQDWKYQPPSSGQSINEEQPIDKEQAVHTTAPVVIGKPKELQKIEQDEQVNTSSFKATYNISLQNLMQSQTDNSQWTRIEDVQLNNKELHFTGKEALQLITRWKFLDSFLDINLKHTININAAHYFDIADNPSRSNELEATKLANKWNWTEESNITLKPLHLFDWFSNSAITHTIKATMYAYKYDAIRDKHEGTFLDLNLGDQELRKRISIHSLVSLLDFQPIKNAYNPVNNLQASLSFSSDLPPSVAQNTLKFRLLFEIFQWSHDFSIQFQQSGEDDLDYYIQPLAYTSIYKPIDQVQIKNVLVFNFEDKNKDKEPHLDKEEISFKAWWFSGGLYFRYSQPYAWDKANLRWEPDGDLDLLAEKIFLGFELTTKDYYFWKNRMLFYFTFKTRWDQDLIRYNRQSSLTMDFTFSFFIYEFLNIQIAYRMSNEKLYLYYPGMKDTLGFSQEHFILQDLWNSISFWEQENQKKGLFQMKDIRVLAIHHLKDWDLIFEFVGKPKQVDKNLSWDYAIGFYLRWIPIPLIKRSVTFHDDILYTDAQ